MKPSPVCRSLFSRSLVAACLLLLAGAGAAEPDAAALGQGRGYPVGTRTTWFAKPYRVGSWSALDRTGLAVRSVAHGEPVRPLAPAASPPEIRYRFRNIGYSLDEYLERRNVTGLLVLKNGEIVAERYRYGRTPEARFLSFSMAKSVTSLLIGMAVERGLIASLDDPAAKYVTALEGSAYGATSLRQLLRMSSGVRFVERYDGRDDIAKLARAISGIGPSPLALLAGLNERTAPAGDRFAYATAETEVLGRVFTAATASTGRSMAELTSDWLWQPMGAERDAFWRIAADGQEQAGGGFNASLRDWGRLGLLLAQNGRIGDRQIVPLDYLMEATDASRQPAAFAPGKATPYLGYGYQFWLYPGPVRTFVLQGVYGQAVYVQPATGIVMVQTAVNDAASAQQDPEPGRERDALWRGVLQSLGAAAP